MNTPLISILALLGVALPAFHLSPAQDRDPDQKKTGKQEKAAEVDAEQAATAATYFAVADYNKNGWISFREASESLGIDRQRFSVYDKDRDGRITLPEFTTVFLGTIEKLGSFPPPKRNPADANAPTLQELIAESAEDPVEEAVEAPKPTTVLELLGTVIPRSEDDLGTPQPDQIVGPVPSFRRLDHDNDGGISQADLQVLARGYGMDLRLNTVLAYLDANSDGVIDREEFLGSMSSAPK